MLVGGLIVLALVAIALFLVSRREDVGGTGVFRDSVAAGPRPVVRLANDIGGVRISGTRGSEVRISAVRYARGADPEAARAAAEGVSIDVAREDNEVSVSTGEGGSGTDYDLEVPSGSTVEVEAGAGDVEVSGLAGRTQIRAEAGDVTVREARGSIQVQAESGDVEIGPVRTETGDVDVDVVSGDLELKDLVVGRLEARVETGSAALTGRFNGTGSVEVGTGDVEVGVPPEDVRNLELSARVGEVLRGEALRGEALRGEALRGEASGAPSAEEGR